MNFSQSGDVCPALATSDHGGHAICDVKHVGNCTTSRAVHEKATDLDNLRLRQFRVGIALACQGSAFDASIGHVGFARSEKQMRRVYADAIVAGMTYVVASLKKGILALCQKPCDSMCWCATSSSACAANMKPAITIRDGGAGPGPALAWTALLTLRQESSYDVFFQVCSV